MLAPYALLLPPWMIYGASVFFPLFYDDLLHLALVEGRSWPELLQPSPAYGYYRPLVLLWTAAVFRSAGVHAALVFHFSAVALHLLNIALLFQLLRRLPPLRAFAFASSLLFGLFPSHYQAILTPAFSLHLWQTFLFLSAGIVYTDRRLSPRARHAALTALFLLAALNHETAILMGLFLAGINAMASLRSRRWLPYAVAGMGYVLLYRILPRGVPPPVDLDPAGLMERGRFALQAFAFPLIPGLHRVMGAGYSGWIFAMALVWIGAAWLAMREVPRRTAGAVGALFFLLAVLPAALLLPTGYFLHGPRLLDLGSIGAALFWGSRLGASARSPSHLRALRQFALIAVAALAAMISARQVRLHARALESIRIIRQIPNSTPARWAVWVNFPEWLADEDRVFPVGSEGALVFGGHLLPGLIFPANSSLRPHLELLQIAVPFNRPRGYAFHTSGRPVDPLGLLREMERADLILFTIYEEDGPRTEVLARGKVRLEMLHVAFSEGLILQEGAAYHCGAEIRVDLLWTRSGPPVVPFLSAAVHTTGRDGRVLGQADGPPWYGAIPFDQIPTGHRLLERRRMRLSPDAQPESVRVGLYDWRNGQRVPIQGAEEPFVYLRLQPCD